MLDSVTVVVVTYMSAHCLVGLHPLLGHCPHVLISDNASQDDSADKAQSLWPRARVLRHSENIGFGAANNRALQWVKTPFALLLNPDCEMAPEQVQALLETALHHCDAAVVAPVLVNTRHKPELNYRWPRTTWRSTGPGADAPCCVGHVSGAVMLCRMAMLSSVALGEGQIFDERFFLYYEDDDLCLRLFDARLSILLDPSIRVMHRSRGSVKNQGLFKNEYLRGYHHAQSKLIFTAKYQGVAQAHKYRRKLVWQTALVLPLRIVFFSGKLISRMWGRLHGVLQWKG